MAVSRIARCLCGSWASCFVLMWLTCSGYSLEPSFWLRV